jgi:hypothetical protein
MAAFVCSHVNKLTLRHTYISPLLVQSVRDICRREKNGKKCAQGWSSGEQRFWEIYHQGVFESDLSLSCSIPPE